MRESAHETGLFSLVYGSTATAALDGRALEELLEQSRRRNRERAITGLLLYRRGRFIQFLEGPEDAVRALYATIAQDPRHEGARILNEGHPERRQFSEWTMGYEPVVDSALPAPAGFRDTFEDLDNAADPDGVVRATQELSLWFRARSRNSTVSDS